MEKVTSYRKILFDAVYEHRINTMGDCHVALTHPETFKVLVDETMSGEGGITTIPHGAVVDTDKINKLIIVGVQVRRCPDIEVGTFEIF